MSFCRLVLCESCVVAHDVCPLVSVQCCWVSVLQRRPWWRPCGRLKTLSLLTPFSLAESTYRLTWCEHVAVIGFSLSRTRRHVCFLDTCSNRTAIASWRPRPQPC